MTRSWRVTTLETRRAVVGMVPAPPMVAIEGGRVVHSKRARLSALAGAVLFTFAACGGGTTPATAPSPPTSSGQSGSASTVPDPATASLTLQGAGATFPNPLYQVWFEKYDEKYSNIQFNYQSIGSGGGIKAITEQTVDFGASDAPMKDDELA